MELLLGEQLAELDNENLCSVIRFPEKTESR
jgi:hypothetical protein